ncbi:stage III sporulation protein AG [Bacillaceae bacterium]
MDKTKLSKLQWFLVAAGIGAAIMIFTSFVSVQREIGPSIDPPQEPAERPALVKGREPSEMEAYEDEYETQLKEILEQIVGVGQVSVMINLESTEEVVVETNRSSRQQTVKEQDGKNGTRDTIDQSREEQVVLVDSDNGQQPIIVKRIKPNVRGVLIVAKGAENLQVKKWILEAVQSVLDVPAHRISILPKKS